MTGRRRFPSLPSYDWFVVNTKPGSEFYARDFLKQQNGSRYHGSPCEVYLPRVMDRWTARPFIPRYLFVADDGRGTDHVRNAPGVTGMMRGGTATFNERWEQVAERDRGVIRVGQAVIDEMKNREDDDGFLVLDDDELATRLGRIKKKVWEKDEKFEIRDEVGNAVMQGLFKRMHGEERALVFISRVVHGRSMGFMKATVPTSKMTSVAG